MSHAFVKQQITHHVVMSDPRATRIIWVQSRVTLLILGPSRVTQKPLCYPLLVESLCPPEEKKLPFHASLIIFGDCSHSLVTSDRKKDCIEDGKELKPQVSQLPGFLRHLSLLNTTKFGWF